MAKRPATTNPDASRNRGIPSVGTLFLRQRPKPPKLTDAAIKRAEKQLGVKLPAPYLNLMRQQNGGKLRLTAIKPKQRPPRFHTHRAVYEFNEVYGIHSRQYNNLVSQAETAHSEWDVPPLLIPFDGDGHWWLCLDYRRCGPTGEPCITHFEPAELIGERPKSCRIADSFEDLLRGLRFDAGGDLLFAIDNPALLEGDLAQHLRKLGCRVRRAKGESPKSPPKQWEWPQFSPSFSTGKASLLLWENGTDDAWHLARPARHPLLHVNVSVKDQDRCARLLHEEFGRALSLIHVPTDRRPPRGVPLEETPQDTKPRPRAKAVPVRPNATSLNAAVLAGDTSLVKELLGLGMSPDKPCIPGGVSALETAAFSSPPAVFDLLWQRSRKRPTNSMLEKAARSGHSTIVESLLKAGATPTTQHLDSAICQGHTEVVKLLLAKGAKPNAGCLRHAAGVTTPSEIGFPSRPQPAIMKLMRAEGKKASDAKVRARFEALK